MNNQGFSLLELLIAICLIAILTVLAYPNYQSYITKTNRIGAETSLMRLASAMEQFYLRHQTYEEATIESLQIPKFTGNHSYQLNVVKTTPSRFLISAIPIGTQSSRDKRCGVLILNNVGEKSISGPDTVLQCWQ